MQTSPEVSVVVEKSSSSSYTEEVGVFCKAAGMYMIDGELVNAADAAAISGNTRITDRNGETRRTKSSMSNGE